MAYLEIKKIDKTFRIKSVTVLKNLTLSAELGTIIGLLGRNGAGKTTLFQILFGIQAASYFEGQINGSPFSPFKNISNQHIAMLPHTSFLPGNRKVKEIIKMFFSEEQTLQKVFGTPKITEISDMRISKLSNGVRKYLESILIINLPHKIILLDEPFSLLEPAFIDLLKSEIEKQKHGKLIIIADHSYEHIISLSNDNYLLLNGSLQTVKSKMDLIQGDY